jgi:cbb3-type cytochrome oxidase cytochrome c subunit
MRWLALVALLVALVSGCGGHATSGSEGPGQVPRWAQLEHLPKQAIPGAAVFVSAGCLACHVYAGSGRTNLNAPDLTAIGRRQLGIQFLVSHLKCPSCVNPGSPMPPFASLGERRLHQLAVFMEASKGTQ